MAGTNETQVCRADAPGIPRPYRTAADLVTAIRRGESAALRQLFLFYAPLLRDQARLMSIPPGERRELAITVLDDFVLHIRDTDVTPRDLTRYLIGALRNRARKRHRSERRQRDTDDRAYVDHGSGGQRIVAECHSEYSLRTALGPDAGTREPIRTALAALAARSALALRADELELMLGLSQHVPLRILAEQAGISYGNARVRVHRLRERFRKLTVQYMETLGPEERSEVERFLRRAGFRRVSSDTPRGQS